MIKIFLIKAEASFCVIEMIGFVRSDLENVNILIIYDLIEIDIKFLRINFNRFVFEDNFRFL